MVRKILLSPGCPDFPPDQWLNIVKGYAVDLSKVLGAHYSSDVEAKQSQDLGKLFQLSKAITSHGDWVIAFRKTIQVISYALPGRDSEYVAYQAYSWASLPLSPPLSTLESLTWIMPSDYEQPIKNTFASVTLHTLTTSEPYTSPHLVWVQVPEKESNAPQSIVQDLPFLEAESPATTRSLCVKDCMRGSGPVPISIMGNGLSHGTTPSALQRLQMRQSSCKSRLTRKCSLVAIQSPLGLLICCQECIACPSMLFPSLGAASLIWLLITVQVSLLSTT